MKSWKENSQTQAMVTVWGAIFIVKKFSTAKTLQEVTAIIKDILMGTVKGNFQGW